MSDKNIYQRLAAISAEINRVNKNLTVRAGGESYKAVSEPDILAVVKPLEDSYGVYSFPLHREILESGIHETKNGAKMLYLRERVVYRFVNIDKPEEFVDMESLGDGMDSQDKAPGKATTYADKYALMKAYKIQTGEDPDGIGSEPMNDHLPTPKKPDEPKPPVQNAGTQNKFGIIKDKIKDTPITLEHVTQWITKKYKSPIRINDLLPEQFAELNAALDQQLNAPVQS